MYTLTTDSTSTIAQYFNVAITLQLKTLPASTPSSSMNKPPSPSPRQRQLSETALSTTVAGVEVKQEVKEETMHNCGDVNSTQQAPVSVTANASTAVSDAGCGGKPLSVQSSGVFVCGCFVLCRCVCMQVYCTL